MDTPKIKLKPLILALIVAMAEIAFNVQAAVPKGQLKSINDTSAWIGQLRYMNQHDAKSLDEILSSVLEPDEVEGLKVYIALNENELNTNLREMSVNDLSILQDRAKLIFQIWENQIKEKQVQKPVTTKEAKNKTTVQPKKRIAEDFTKLSLTDEELEKFMAEMSIAQCKIRE